LENNDPNDYIRQEIDKGIQTIRDSFNKAQPEVLKLATASSEHLPDELLVSTIDLVKKLNESSAWLQIMLILVNVSCHEKEDVVDN